MAQRRVVQICPHPDGIAALADDGSIWWTNGTQGWVEMTPLPPYVVPEDSKFQPMPPPKTKAK